MTEVLIAGGGPAGSLAAYMLGRGGFEVLLAEEHQSPGFPVQCAGLISDRCLEHYGRVVRVRKCVEKKIEGAIFISPSGVCVEAEGRAYVVERKILDRMLFEKASMHVETVVKAKVSLNPLRVGERRVDAKFVIGADGVYSAVARAFGFERPPVYSCLQTEVRYEPIDDRYVEVYFGRRFSDFFAYAIPLEDSAKIGVVCRSNALEKFRRFEDFLREEGRLKGSKIELVAGAIPAKLVDFAAEKVALIGDAAGMVKPYTGGGLMYIFEAANALADNFPDLKAYKRAYLKKLGKEHRLGELIRRLYTLPDRELDGIFENLRDFDFSGVHMDSPSTLLRKFPRILAKPGLLAALLRAFI
ncbi:MAG: NAD(P)/FAD-dependent oxidoreductase [Archaeoglobaceae archaeon]